MSKYEKTPAPKRYEQYPSKYQPRTQNLSAHDKLIRKIETQMGGKIVRNSGSELKK